MNKLTKNSLQSTDCFELPERVLQFGTGVLLRGLPDYYIDKANKHGVFKGRVVVVKSTDGGDANAFAEQDNLYTVCVRGILDGQDFQENIINSSISRVLSAKSDWEAILKCVENKEIDIIISNTTEVGLQYVAESILQQSPLSFPAKLLAYLQHRFVFFQGDASAGMVIIPTELISNNADKLKGILLDLIRFNQLSPAFEAWVFGANIFCNSLVDRIVPGKPKGEILEKLNQELGYQDDLLTVAEVFSLWAIEGDERVKAKLSFASVDAGVVITEDITKFKELKLRLLNGTHTLGCGVAILSGFKTVKEAMQNTDFYQYLHTLMMEELAPSIPFEIDFSESQSFGNKVLERFMNPHLEHQWLSISLNFSSKMKMRNVPMLLRYYENNGQPPVHFVRGFAAYLVFMKAVKFENNTYFGELNQQSYPINDETAALFYEKWQLPTQQAVHEILSDTNLWDIDLTQLPHFETEVLFQVQGFIQA